MKRGFTLIEIMAVVLILATIFLIAYPTLHGILKKSEEDETKYNEENIIIAAHTYFNLHTEEFTFAEGSKIEVKLNKLVEEDLLDDNDYKENDKVECTINNNKKDCEIIKQD